MLHALLLPLALSSVAPDTTVRIARGTTIEVEAGMADVRLATADGDVVTVAGAEVRLRSDRLEVEAAMFGRRGTTGPIVLTVPRWARVEISAVNGAIDVRDAPEELQVEAFNGAITTRGGTGTLVISSATGGVTVRDFRGRLLEIEALSGVVSIEGAQGTLHVETVNDQIVMRDVRSVAVHVESTNGGIDWAGTLAPEGRYEFASHNGPVTLRVPRALDARLQVRTFQGSFETGIAGKTTGDGGAGRRGQWGGEREFTVTYGAGSARVAIETFNGGIRIVPRGEP